MKNEEMKNKIIKLIDDNKKEIIYMADYIHDNPEIGHKEYKAMNMLTSALEKRNFTVKKGVNNMDTAFIATKKGKKDRPTIGLLCEYDALIGLGHACGHNLIGAGAVGAAIALNEVITELDGTLLVFGTPAEEGGVDNAGGKCLLTDEFKKTDVCLIWHPGTQNIARRSSSMAREAIQFEFYGKASHAGGAPWAGNNALNAALIMFRGIDALRQHVKPEVRLHGFIEKGGVTANIVPDHTIVKFYVRALDINYLNEVAKRVKNCAKAGALATDTEVKYWDYANTYANTIPNIKLADAIEKNFEYLGVEVYKPPEGKSPVSGGSTDVGNVSQVTPITSFSLSIGPEELRSHSEEFNKAAKSEAAHEAVITSSKVLALTAIDLFNNKKLVQDIRDEWKSKLSSY